jgi:hypothetical protein
LYAVDYDPFEISVSLYAFHTVVTDFIRIQVTSVTLAASDTFPVVQYARTVHLSAPSFGMNYTSAGKEWSSAALYADRLKRRMENEHRSPETRKGKTRLVPPSVDIPQRY